MNTPVSDTDEEKPSIRAEGPGRRLKTLRESEDLDLSRVSILLHLSEEKLAALEADEYEKLPGPVFVQGYLRNYAKLLGLPVEPILNAYHAVSPESSRISELKITQVSHEVRSGHALVRLATWGIVIGLILLSVVWWRGYLQWPMRVPGSMESESENLAESAENENEETDAIQKFPVVEVNEDGAVTLALPQSRPEQSSEPPVPDRVKLDGERVETGVKPAVAESIEPTPQPDSVDIAEGSSESSSATVEQVVIEYSGNSWTKVEDASGSFKLEESNKAGARRVLKGVPPYRIVLGNAAAVKILVNGRDFDISPYNRGNVARFTLDPESQPR
jgi:cytoskeleton protein RodZ